MGVRRTIRVLGKRKRAIVPPRREIDRMLKGLYKFRYIGVRDHCTLCEIAARNVALQLNKAKKARVNPTLVSRAALAHDVFRQLSQKGMNEERVAIKYFSGMGFPEIAELVGPMESLEHGKVTKQNLGKLSLEQKIVLYADSVCRGIPVAFNEKGEPTKWKQDIFPLQEAYQTLVNRHLEQKKGGKKGTKDSIKAVDRAFFLKWVIELQLKEKGLDAEKLIRDTRKQFRNWKLTHYIGTRIAKRRAKKSSH